MLIEVVTPLCVLAIGFLGFAMLSGRLKLRRGFSVVGGCFVLLGAPFMAANLCSLLSQSRLNVAVVVPLQDTPNSPCEDLPPVNNDSFAGASFVIN